MRKDEVNSGADENMGDYIFEDNFDEDGVANLHKNRTEAPAKTQTESSGVPDYGDGFDSQTGEQTEDLGDYYNTDYEDSYVKHKSKAAQNNTNVAAKGKGSKKRKGKRRPAKILAAVFAVLAIICVIAAAVFVLTKCTDNGEKNPIAKTSASTETQAVTEEFSQPEQGGYYEEPTYAPIEYSQAETEAVQYSEEEPQTEATQAVTEEYVPEFTEAEQIPETNDNEEYNLDENDEYLNVE